MQWTRTEREDLLSTFSDIFEKKFEKLKELYFYDGNHEKRSLETYLDTLVFLQKGILTDEPLEKWMATEYQWEVLNTVCWQVYRDARSRLYQKMSRSRRKNLFSDTAIESIRHTFKCIDMFRHISNYKYIGETNVDTIIVSMYLKDHFEESEDIEISRKIEKHDHPKISDLVADLPEDIQKLYSQLS